MFPPTRTEALHRADAVDPAAYARTRNALDGAVTRLSPYLTHGLTDVSELVERIGTRHRLRRDDKLCFEFGWREYFHHAWRCLGDDIWTERRAPPCPGAYAAEVPEDVRAAATGVPVIDATVRALYRDGWLHNHARMWLASYLVHLRKVDWRAGARWMYRWLLDGDLASNTLSWQWVAGTWTGKPYLFDAANVAKYAPALASPGTALDASYDELDRRARAPKTYPERAAVRAFGPGIAGCAACEAEPVVTRRGPGREAHAPVEPTDPAFAAHARDDALFGDDARAPLITEADVSLAPPSADIVWLAHPWSLHLPDDRPAIGLVLSDFHRAHPWSEARWRFVLDAMRARCERLVVTDLARLVQAWPEVRLQAVADGAPAYRDALARVAPDARLPARLFRDPPTLQGSFSKWWSLQR